MSAKSRRWAAALLCLEFAAVAGMAQEPLASVPQDFTQSFNTLASLFDKEDLSPVDMARGTYEGAKFFSVGSSAVPYAQKRFLDAKTEGEAGVGGLFVTVHGKPQDFQVIQHELETSASKRAWLADLVGTEEAFSASIDSGAQWKDFLRVLPSATGVRIFSAGCIKSKDFLVRRAGMFWGYWFGGQAYWNEVKSVSSGDPDPKTRLIAIHLMNPRQKKPAE